MKSEEVVQGQILKGVGGFYTILTQEGDLLTAKARGRFRKDGISPLCGDFVKVEPQKDSEAYIVEILKRRNELIRPAVSNITKLILVFAASPKPDLLLLDKLLIMAALKDIEPIIVINKCDLLEQQAAASLRDEYARAFKLLTVSALTGEGMDELETILKEKNSVSCFAGQSAVGKSSLLNTLIPDLNLQTGGLAKKTERGKHTTRHAELWRYGDGAVLDTPGFSLLEFPNPPPLQEEIDKTYPEFDNAPRECRFAKCRHMSEPDCAVKARLEDKLIAKGRYERYITLIEQIEEMRRRRYD